MVRTVSRRGRVATKPRVAALYNEGMGGVDLGDQKTYTYSDDRRQVKLWKKNDVPPAAHGDDERPYPLQDCEE